MSTVPVLRFLGGTGTVTGSRFLVETGTARVLVDCGLFQGLKELRLRNWAPFPVPPASLDAVLVTHAHLDHSGYLPALVRDGFAGSIFVTPGTDALCRIVLPDSAHIQEEDAAYANRKAYTKHAPALPLYTEADARAAIGRLRSVPFEHAVEIASGVQATFRPAGHILGAATVTLALEATGRVLTCSGDLGRPTHPLLRAPAPLAAADVLLVESTYGDRRHDDGASLEAFAAALRRTATRGGVAVIPSFAVDRTEVVLFHLRLLFRSGAVPAMPVYVDSPLASAALAIYRQALAGESPELLPALQATADPFDPGTLREVRTVEESKALSRVPGPAVIVSASGMATGGRVLHHLLNRLPGDRNCIILPGYQAAGTRGRALLDGASAVKLLGRYVDVRADIVHVPAFSVHADQGELLDWLGTAPRPPAMTFVVHGEPPASAALQQAIHDTLRWAAAVPRHLETVRLD
jgi:metallo-beta-lactamase family protein